MLSSRTLLAREGLEIADVACRHARGRGTSARPATARARRALAEGVREALAGGERDLARPAAELGFADQSHLCRVAHPETGRAPALPARAL